MNKKVFIVFLITIAVIGLIGYSGKDLARAAQDDAATEGNAVTPHTVGQDEIGKAATCPVCGMDLTVQSTTPALEYEGQVYYFDSNDCATTFTADADAYANPPENP